MTWVPRCKILSKPQSLGSFLAGRSKYLTSVGHNLTITLTYPWRRADARRVSAYTYTSRLSALRIILGTRTCVNTQRGIVAARIGQVIFCMIPASFTPAPRGKPPAPPGGRLEGTWPPHRAVRHTPAAAAATAATRAAAPEPPCEQRERAAVGSYCPRAHLQPKPAPPQPTTTTLAQSHSGPSVALASHPRTQVPRSTSIWTLA